MVQSQFDMQKDIDKQVSLLKKVMKEHDDARNDVTTEHHEYFQ